MIRKENLSGSIKLVCLADVQPIPLEWLWADRFPLGKLTLIVGDPDVSKSIVTLSLASAVSRGAPWPDAPNNPQPVGGVVMLSAEDDPNDTIRPRLDAVGADCERIHLLQSLYDVGSDLEQLRQAIDSVENCRLVVIDPAPAYLGRVDTHKDADVRRVLTPLVQLAAEKRVALVLVMHLNKREVDAMYRTSGSVAFVAAARAVWLVSRDPLDPDRRLMTLVKNNLTANRTGVAYRIQRDGDSFLFSWERDPVTMTASEALAPAKRGPAADTRNKAADWLQRTLADGAKPAPEVIEAGAVAGLSRRTLYRAFRELPGHSERRADGTALWSLSELVPSNSAIEKPGIPGIPGTRNSASSKSVFGILDFSSLSNGHSAKYAKNATLFEAESLAHPDADEPPADTDPEEYQW